MKRIVFFASLLGLSITIVACGGSVDGGGIPGPGPAPTTTSTSPSPPTTTNPPPTSTTEPPTPGPTHFYGSWSATASGCSDFTVYAADTNHPRYLVIKASKSELKLGVIGSTATVDLANTKSAPSTDVGVDTAKGASPPPAPPYCTDVGSVTELVHRKAYSGTVTFKVTSVGKDDGTYAITVTLKDVVFQSDIWDGETETIPDITFSNVGVGWYPG